MFTQYKPMDLCMSRFEHLVNACQNQNIEALGTSDLIKPVQTKKVFVEKFRRTIMTYVRSVEVLLSIALLSKLEVQMKVWLWSVVQPK